MNFSVRNVQYQHLCDGFVITVTTDVPCHLYMRWTTVEPQKHSLPRIRRGIAIPGQPYYCFVSYRDNDQAEAGDTLIHTFTKTSWPVCETRWFYFWGAIGGTYSPSTSCLFELHFPNSIISPALFQHYITGDNTHWGVWGTAAWRAQTFTPCVSHHIRSVKLKVSRLGLPGPAIVSIRATSVDLPTGPDLGAGTLDVNALTTDIAGEWKEIILSNLVNVTASAKYAIVVRCPGGDAFFNLLWWRIDTIFPTYAGGARCDSNDAGLTWHEVIADDFMFEEWS